MLQTSYQCHRLIDSGEDFESTIFGHDGHVCHVTPTV